MIVVSKRHINTRSRCGSRRCGCSINIHICPFVCLCVCMCVCMCVCVCECVCAGERERQYMRKTMAQRRKHASFSASSATKRGLTNIARPSSKRGLTNIARPSSDASTRLGHWVAWHSGGCFSAAYDASTRLGHSNECSLYGH